MSEPVGNANRSSPLPGSNSHKARTAMERASAPEEPREKASQVVQGRVTKKKANIFKRMGRNMVADDVTNVGDFVLAEVLMPAIRNLVYDIVSQGSYRILYGTSRARRGPHAYPVGGGPVSSLKMAYHKVGNEPEAARYSISREDQARHNFDELILESHSDAIEVLESLRARVDRYGSASVADLYDYLGVTGGFTDQKYGWTSLANAGVRQIRGGFILDLPRPIQLG